jgi:hypothetical protein
VGGSLTDSNGFEEREMMTTEKKPTKGRVAKSPNKNAGARGKFEKALGQLDEEFKVWTDTIHESERLSEDDFAIRINARD